MTESRLSAKALSFQLAAEMSGAPAYEGITYVIPCGGGKLDHAAPAAELYTGSMFRHALVNVERLAAMDEDEGRGPARVLILSALHGLVTLDTVLEPYDLRMGAPGSVTVETLAAQLIDLGVGVGDRPDDVFAFLPRAYFERLEDACELLGVTALDSYEDCRGNGEQRRVLSTVGLPSGRPVDVEPAAGDGPHVWIGADVNGFAWGVPILVSYGRLRDAQTLPVARAPWVCDSWIQEVFDHGRRTVTPEEYVADLRRFAAEIGRPAWVSPQDWPASASALAVTGLTEEESQRRTVASVVQLRAMAPELDVVAVLTATDAAGYVRMIGMYAAAGIDLYAERLPVGVGALLGRPADEAAGIVKAVHAAGLHNLHGFGAKGRVLDLVGDMLTSLDSSGWSAEARRRGGKCPHGLVAWERNCPRAAVDWADAQRARAVAADVQPVLPLFV